jgi:ferredoxin
LHPSLLPFIEQAKESGLSISALLSTKNFPELFSKESRSVLLLGSTGLSFFESFQREAQEEPDPLDSYTRHLVHRLVESFLPEALGIYFPFEEPFLPFQKFAIEAGLGLAGPLGILVSSEYGPWFALRAAVSLPYDTGLTPIKKERDICLSCSAPCITACPASAVRRVGLEVDACGEARHSGPCLDRCVAREACPVGVGWRYQEAAIHFHHRGASLFFPKKK